MKSIHAFPTTPSKMHMAIQKCRGLLCDVTNIIIASFTYLPHNKHDFMIHTQNMTCSLIGAEEEWGGCEMLCLENWSGMRYYYKICVQVYCWEGEDLCERGKKEPSTLLLQIH
jgi:hypothetical protein